MDRSLQAEELIQLFTQLIHCPSLETTQSSARGEGALLGYLAQRHDGATAGELRGALAVGSGRVANALKSLEAKGYISRAPSASDGRVVQVFLTPAGRAIALERHRQMLCWCAQLMEELGEEDTQETLRLFRRIVQVSAQLNQRSGA